MIVEKLIKRVNTVVTKKAIEKEDVQAGIWSLYSVFIILSVNDSDCHLEMESEVFLVF